MTEKDIILFTGQSGIKAEKCIRKLIEKGDLFASIEQEMEKISDEKFKEQILAYPPFRQEELWSSAFDQIEKEKISKIEKGKYLFLTFHACYYHQKETTFLSPINFNKLQKITDRVKMVIVLIDDCYDIYRRLLGKGEMYEYIKHESKYIVNEKEIIETLKPFDALIESIMNLLDLLSWREIEIAFSRKIAHCLNNIPFYIIGVKHPRSMASRIIRKPCKELKIAYLVHPISEVRKRYHPRIPEFIGELSEFIKKRLRQEDLVLFVPDTIDEKRIEKENIGKDSYQYMPKLSGSWSLPFQDDWLFVPITPDLQRIEPLNPNDFKFQGAGKAIKSMISSIIKLLETKISSQINARDLSLVESSNFLLVYRPYWSGKSPSGVEAEMRYNNQLRTRYNQKNRKVIMISATEDMGRLNINTFFREVNNIILNESSKRKLGALCEEWLHDPQKLNEFYEKKWNIKDIKKSVEDTLPDSKNYEFDKKYGSSREGTTLKPSHLCDANDILEECWKKVFQKTSMDHPLSKFIDASRDVFICCPQKDLYKKIDDLTVEN